ncbi:fibroblast growth factor receptor 1-like isoform X2 [Xenia sp. Carnegie-2017]|uniref:fibroblast growth factor receptor 1-like isoform X2 n=1 Tax=Xenia sp. Carnegie-2017 TaxID=2897299 RepID=UPI001F038DBA|nr:fibroblast growth factor receptor 1-like isoform X2 [Xenia sp. Carnegie-2017]
MTLMCNKVGVLMLYFVFVDSRVSTSNISSCLKKGRPIRIIILPGEWVMFNCSVNHNDLNVQILNSKREILHVDNSQIKILSKNVFNVTNLTKSDKYTCNRCQVQYNIMVLSEIPSYQVPLITKEPDKTIYDYKERVTLNCKLIGPSYLIAIYYRISWKRNGKTEKKCKRDCKLPINITPESVGSYECSIERKLVHYKSSQKVTIKLKEFIKPNIYIENDADVFSLGEGKNLTFTYNVTSYPAADIFWWRLKDHELITSCFSANNLCKNHTGPEYITRSKFEVKSVTFPNYNRSYKINATNIKGYEMKTISIQVLVAPKIEINKQVILLKKGFSVLNCRLNKIYNQRPVTFKWFICKFDFCKEHNNEDWKYISSNYSLTVQNEGRYRCTANNTGGTDTSPIITIIKESKPTGRKKIYGGFYLLSYPPMPDYIEKIDMNGNIQEQIQKLPFIPEWEFPRERITFINELGSGEFGVVWLAEAVGISAFHPRDILREKGSRRRFPFINRMVKRNSYVYSREVTKVAVKKTKDVGDQNNVIDLQSELKILIHVGENENIVNILGACTKGKTTSLWIIMEFCEHGNLRQFLRDSRDRYNKDEEFLMNDLSLDFGPKNLIQLAYQITKGMEFLVSRKIVHRDLAARNVLLGKDFTAKVADFGLARDIYKYQAYKKNTPGLLPIKWMAIESIRDSIYTEKTDIWSFGVVLWELFTLELI